MTENLASRKPRPHLPEPAERKRLREIMRVTQMELAREFGVTRKTVYAWERGSEPASKHLDKYAALLKRWATAERRSQANAS